MTRRPPPPHALRLGFDRAFGRFLANESANIRSGVSERNLCGHLGFELRVEANDPSWAGYYVDLEYNRKQGGQVKTILDERAVVVSITCDLIIHSRGQIPSCDNLIAIEMKKASHPAEAKEADRRRLRALTKTSFDGVWSADGETLPEHVCGYLLGLLIDLDGPNGRVSLEEYRRGELFGVEQLHF